MLPLERVAARRPVLISNPTPVPLLISAAPAFLALALVVGAPADSWLKNHQAATAFLEIGYTSRLLRKD